MNLRQLIDAIRARDWLTVLSIVGEMLQSFGKPAIGTASETTDEDVTELEEALAEAKGDTAEVKGKGKGEAGVASTAAIDPGTVISLITIVMELIKQWRSRK